MNLEQGVRYVITAAKDASIRRTKNPSSGTSLDGLVSNSVNNPIQTHDAPQINYILDLKDEPKDFKPDFSLACDKLLDRRDLTIKTGEWSAAGSNSPLSELGHNGLAFFGAPQATFTDILHNELFSPVQDDTMYLVQGAGEVKSGGTPYSHGQIFTATSDAPTRVSGSPILVKVFKHGQTASGSRFYVYGDQSAIDSGIYITIGGSSTKYYPGDVVTSSGMVTATDSDANIALVPSVNNNNANMLRMFWKDNNIDLSSAVSGVSYLVYDNVACIYSNSTIKVSAHSNNVFKTTSADIYGQSALLDEDANNLSRKKPILREVVKSDDIEEGETYLLYHDMATGFERSNSVSHGDIVYSSSEAITSFKGRAGVTDYFPSGKSFDKTIENFDSELKFDLSPLSEYTDASSGNSIVVKKEPAGLKAGQKYVMVADPVASIEIDQYYILSNGEAIYYNNKEIKIGEIFKGIQDAQTWRPVENISDGTEEVTLVTNSIKVQVAGVEETYTTTIKDRKIEFIPSDNSTLANSSVIVQWKLNDGDSPSIGGKPYVYPVVTELKKDKQYFVAAEGDGRIVYPSLDLNYKCVSPFEDEEVQEKLIKSELNISESNAKKDIYLNCINKGGRWQPEIEEYFDNTKILNNRDSFFANKGKCEKGTTDFKGLLTESACLDQVEGSTGTTWNLYNTYKEVKDSLNVYASESTADLALPIQVVFEETNPTALTPKDTSNTSAVYINVAPLIYPLKAEQVIRFPQQTGDGPLPSFIVKQDADIGADEINGILLYDSILDKSVPSNPTPWGVENIAKKTGVLSLETSNSEVDANGVVTSSSPCYYYAEPVEITVSDNDPVVSESDNATVKFDSLPVEFKVDELITLEHSTGNSQLKVISYNKSSKEITGKLTCPHGTSLPNGAKAKLSNKKVGHYSVNTKLKNNSIFYGVSGKPVVRFKGDTLIKPVQSDNIETLEAAEGSIREVVAQGSAVSSVSLPAGTYVLRGSGFVTLDGVDYYPKAKGKIKVNHENGTGSYYEYGQDPDSSETISVETSIKIEESPVHVPSEVSIEFASGTFVLTEKINVGDQIMMGRMSLSGQKIYHADQSLEIDIPASNPDLLLTAKDITLSGGIIVCKSGAITGLNDPYDNNTRPEKRYIVSPEIPYFVETEPLQIGGVSVPVYADYFAKEEIYSGNKFEIIKRIDKSRTGKTKLNLGQINGSEARYDYEAKDEDYIYMLPTSPMPHIESFGKVYKLSHDYIVDGASFTGLGDYTYKVGGKGEGYVVASGNHSIGSTFTSSSTITLSPSVPVVYEKETTTLEPDKYYTVEAPENYSNDSSVTNLTTIEYNNKKYFADVSYLYVGSATEKIKYNNVSYNVRHFNLSSYLFGRIDTFFFENVRNYNGGLGKIKLKEITSAGKVDVALSNNYRFFDISLNNFENFNILRKDKFYDEWGYERVTEQQVEGDRTQVSVVGGSKAYEFPLSVAIGSGNISNPYKASGAADSINPVYFHRLLDTEILQDDIQDIKYRVESSHESNFTVSDSNAIQVSRSVSPKAENRLKVGREYYLKQGKITYLNYAGRNLDALGYFDTGAPTITIDSESGGSKVFTGKSDAFNGEERILYGTETHLFDLADSAETSGLPSSLVGCRMGAFEYWNILSNNPLVYPVVKPWEIESNRRYTIAGGTLDAIEYDGKVYKNGDTFRGSVLSAGRPLSVDTAFFESQLSASSFKEFSARGMRPWMDESAFKPRERGFIELTPLLYRTVTGGIKAGQKYIAYKSSSGGSISYDNRSYAAKSAIAHADNFKDIASGATAQLAGGNWKKKIKQGDKIEQGSSYSVHGSGKVKYIAQVKAHTQANHNDTSITVSSVPVAIGKFTLLEFSNGSTFVLDTAAGYSAASATLSGTLTGDLPAGSIAPIIKNKSNGQVTIKVTVPMVEDGEDVSDRTILGINVLPLPFNMASGEILYFSDGTKLTISQNSLSGEERLYGKLDHPVNTSLMAGKVADIVYEKEIQYTEHEGKNDFSDTFGGLEGYDYFEIIEGRPEVYLEVPNDNNQSYATVGEGRYYLFGTSDQNSTTPSNIFYGVSGQTGFTASGDAAVLQVVGLGEATENYNAGISETYKVYGNSSNNRPLISIYSSYYNEYYSRKHGEEFRRNNVDLNDTEWDSDMTFVKYRNPIEVQAPSGPVVYTKTQKILDPGQAYILQSLGDKDNERGVVKYVEMGGVCKRADLTTIESINQPFDCLTGELIRYKDGEAKKGEEGKASGVYADGLSFEIKVSNLDFYDLSSTDAVDSFTGTYTNSEGVLQENQTISNHQVKKYLVCKQGQPITFENGAILIPSENVYIEGEYILYSVNHPVSPEYLGSFSASPETENACLTLGGFWTQDEAGNMVCQSPAQTTTLKNKHILNKEWMPLTIKGEVVQPEPLRQLDEAPLLLWKEDFKTAYFTTDGSAYNSSTKRVAQNGIESGVQYTLAGGNEISYNGQKYKIGSSAFTGVAGVGSWLGTPDSSGSEYVTTSGTNTSFIALSTNQEVEVVSGNPIVFKQGEGFIEKATWDGAGETLVIEGGPVKIMQDMGNLSSLSYNEDACGNKLTGTIPPRSAATPAKYSPGKFSSSSNVNYSINPPNWSSTAWAYNSDGGIRSAKLHNAWAGEGGEEKSALSYLSEPSYRVGDSGFLEAGVTECENYVDLELDSAIDSADVTCNGTLIYEGFRTPYAAKSKIQFPEVEPYGGLEKSETDVTGDESFSDLVNLYAERIVKDADAFVFGKGEIVLYNLQINTSQVTSIQRAKAYSNLNSSWSLGVNCAEGPVASNLEESYRYVVAGPDNAEIVLPLTTIVIKGNYHSLKFDNSSQANFVNDTGLDVFENSVASGILFWQTGYKLIPSGTTSLTFTSVINVTEENQGEGTLTVSPLPVNLEKGEIIESSASASSYITITEKALLGSTSIKATLQGSETAFTRKVTLSNNSLWTDFQDGEVDDTANGRLKGVLSPGHNRNQITSLTHGQVADTPVDSSSDTGYVSGWAKKFTKGERFAATQNYTSSEIEAIGSSNIEIRYSNVIPKTMFAGNYDSGRQDIAMKYPKIEYSIGDTKILFKINDPGSNGLPSKDEYFINNQVDSDVTGITADGVDANENGYDDNIYNSDYFKFIRHHLYDTDYSSSTLATVTVDDGGTTKTTTAKNNFFIYDGSGSINNNFNIAPISSTGLNIKSKNLDPDPLNLGSEIYIYREVISGEIKAGGTYLAYGAGFVTYGEVERNAIGEFEVEAGSEDFYGNAFVGTEDEGTGFSTRHYYETYWDPTNEGILLGDGSYQSDIPIGKRQRRVCAPRVYELIYSNRINENEYDKRSTLTTGDICYVYGEGGVKYKNKTIYATNKYIAAATQNWDDSDSSPTTNNYQVFPESFVYAGRINKTIGHEYSEEETGIINPVHGIHFFAENKFTEGSLVRRALEIDRDSDVVFYKKVHAIDGITGSNSNPKDYYVFSNNLEKHPVGTTDEDTGIVTLSHTITVSAVSSTTITVSPLPCDLEAGQEIIRDANNKISILAKAKKGATSIAGELTGTIGNGSFTSTVADALSAHRSTITVNPIYTPRGSASKENTENSGVMTFASVPESNADGGFSLGNAKNSIIEIIKQAKVGKAGVFAGIWPTKHTELPANYNDGSSKYGFTEETFTQVVLDGSGPAPIAGGSFVYNYNHLSDTNIGFYKTAERMEDFVNHMQDNIKVYYGDKEGDYVVNTNDHYTTIQAYYRGDTNFDWPGNTNVGDPNHSYNDGDSYGYRGDYISLAVNPSQPVDTVGYGADTVTTIHPFGEAKHIVKGTGFILYPVNIDGSNIDFKEQGLALYNYQYGRISSSAKKFLRRIDKYTYRLTRRINVGEVFDPVWWYTDLGVSGSTASHKPQKVFSQFFVKGTGGERVYKLPHLTKDHWYWKGLDTFRGIAPDRLGFDEEGSNQIIEAGISYRVLVHTTTSFTQDAIKRSTMTKEVRGEEGDVVHDVEKSKYFIFYYESKDGKVVLDGGGEAKLKKYNLGETFVGVSGFPVFSKNHADVFVRKESGTYGNAPEQGWSNQWSMFMTSINSGPDNNTTSLWHDSVYGDVLGFLHNRCHLHSLDFQSNRYGHLLQTFAYGIKPVKRSEAAPGYTFLEGSNSQQTWFSIVWTTIDDTASLQTMLNNWFFTSCQIYKPDYIVDTVKCIDVGQYVNIGEGSKYKFLPADGWTGQQTGVCWNADLAKVVDADDQDECYKIEGNWMKLRDRVEVVLNRRLSHTPGNFKPKVNVSMRQMDLLRLLHNKALVGGLTGPEPYRTDENALIEYLIKQRKYIWKSQVKGSVYDDHLDEDGHFIQLQCHKAKIGDSAPDMNVWYDPDDPWGACAPRFYFTKLVPYAFDNNTGKFNESKKSAVGIKQFQQMELYLRGMSGGFVDQESNPSSSDIEYGGNVKLHELSPFLPVCVLSKDYDYLFENLAFQALDDQPSLTSKEACEAIGGVWKEEEKKCSVVNYKNVEIYHDQEDLSITRQRKYKIERRINLPALSEDGTYIIIRLGSQFMVNGKVVLMSFTPPTIGESSVFEDVYEQTLTDRGSRKNYNIPITQKYTIYYPNKTSFPYTVGIDDTHVLEDSQSYSKISWPNKGGRDYILQRKTSPISSIGDWVEGGTATVSGSMLKTVDSSAFVVNTRLRWRHFMSQYPLGLGFNTPVYRGDISVNIDSLSEFQKVEFRIRVFKKEILASGARLMEVTPSGSVSNPFPVDSKDTTEGLFTDSGLLSRGGQFVNLPIDGRIPTQGGSGHVSLYNSYETGGNTLLAAAVRGGRRPTGDPNTDAYYSIAMYHVPALWLGGGPKTTPIGAGNLHPEILTVEELLHYRVEYRIHTTYPNSFDRDAEWETIAKFASPSGSSMTYRDDDNYKFQNVTYRVACTAFRQGGSRWISPMFRYDRMIRPDDPVGFGPLQNVKLRAALFNQFSNAINLLREVRIDVPITIRHKQVTKQWIKKDLRVSNDDNSNVLLCSGDYGDSEFVPEGQDPDSPHHRRELPTFGGFAHHEHMSVCPKVILPGLVTDLATYKFDQSYTVAGEFIGEFEGDWNVESGYFSVCAGKGFGYSTRAWFDSSAAAWLVMLYQDDVIKIDIPASQSALRYAVPFFMQPLLKGEKVKVSGLLEDQSGESQWTKSEKSFSEVKNESTSAFESMIFCRDLADHGGEADHVYGFLGEGQHPYWSAKEERVHTSKCKDIVGSFELHAPPLGDSDVGMLSLPGGNISGYGTKHVCSKGGSFSSQCFSTRASTGDNNMTLKIPVEDSIRFLPFSSATNFSGGTGSFKMIKTAMINPQNHLRLMTVEMIRVTEWNII